MKTSTSEARLSAAPAERQATPKSVVGGAAARLGNGGLYRVLQREAGIAQNMQRSPTPPRPPQSARPPCPTIKDVDARVDSGKERWKAMEDGAATFHFSGNVRPGGCQNVRHEWDFGDGTSSSDLALDHTYTKPGEYEVELTARCEDCPDGDAVVDAVKVIALEIDHHTTSSRVSDPRRTTLGVGEELVFIVKPHPLGLTASASEGVINRTSVDEFTFMAPSRASRPRIFIGGPGALAYGLRLEVWQPNQITMRREHSTVVAWDGPGVYLQARAQLHALDDQGVEQGVSFENVEVMSRPARAEELEGYFEDLALTWTYSDPGFGWATVGSRNLVFPTDETLIKGPQFEPSTDWKDGSFLVERVWRYRVKGDPAEFDLTTTMKYVAMEGSGKVHDPGTLSVYEAGACAVRAPDAFEYPCRA
jgi:PKD repeat protein